jgi:hypothetical protein
MPDLEKPNHLVSGFHSRGVLPHLKREGGTYFVTFRQAGTLPKDVLLRFKAEREAIIKHAQAAKRPLTWHEQEHRCEGSVAAAAELLETEMSGTRTGW